MCISVNTAQPVEYNQNGSSSASGALLKAARSVKEAVKTFFIDHRTAFQRLEIINGLAMILAFPSLYSGRLPFYATHTMIAIHGICQWARIANDDGKSKS